MSPLENERIWSMLQTTPHCQLLEDSEVLCQWRGKTLGIYQLQTAPVFHPIFGAAISIEGRSQKDPDGRFNGILYIPKNTQTDQGILSPALHFRLRRFFGKDYIGTTIGQLSELKHSTHYIHAQLKKRYMTTRSGAVVQIEEVPTMERRFTLYGGLN